MTDNPNPTGEGLVARFWLIVHEPGLVPDLKGSWPLSELAKVMREFIEALPTAYLTVLTVDESGHPHVQHGPEALQMADGRSMGTGRKHNKRTKTAHVAALSRQQSAVGGDVLDLVKRLDADADRWMACDDGRDNEEAGHLSHDAARQIEGDQRLISRLLADAAELSGVIENLQAAASPSPEAGQASAEEMRAEIINTPETADFMAGVPLEAAHQRERWGASHDGGKTPFDWFWLIGYLAQKAASSAVAGDTDKARHHTISTAAALANWHAALSGLTDMRPGIGPDNGGEKPGSAYELAAALSPAGDGGAKGGK